MKELVAIEPLTAKSSEIRLRVLDTALRAGKGHVPPAFSWVEIGVALFYGGVLRVRPSQPQWPDRDRFILSKGHACLTLYAILSDLGFFSPEELQDFCADGALLSGHPDPVIPGVEAMSGSLGHGLGIGAGMAMGLAMDGKDSRIYVVLGDGECQEGSVWEAAMFASHHRLGNLTAIVDRNRLGATDYTERSLALEPFADRWESFGWEVAKVDGHSFEELHHALVDRGDGERPRVIIADTIKGKGVTFMESSTLWHHRLPKGAEIPAALRELQGVEAR